MKECRMDYVYKVQNWTRIGFAGILSAKGATLTKEKKSARMIGEGISTSTKYCENGLLGQHGKHGASH